MTDSPAPRYSWSPQVAAQVAALPELGSAAFWAQVERSDRFSSQQLRPETLVIVIRRLQAAGDGEGVRRVAAALAPRWEGWVRDRSWSYFPRSPEDREDFAGAVFARLFGELVDPKESFWEANFVHALTYLAADVARPIRRARRILTEADLQHDSESGSALPDQIDSELGPEGAAFVSEALRLLDDPERTAVYLRYLEDWPIVDSDGRPSISQHLGVTDRTVRNYLNRGLKKLRDHYGGQGVAR